MDRCLDLNTVHDHVFWLRDPRLSFMFTPPPSPGLLTKGTTATPGITSSASLKRRRIALVVVVPLVLAFVTFSAHCITHPTSISLSSDSSILNWEHAWMRRHERVFRPREDSAAFSAASSTASSAASSAPSSAFESSSTASPTGPPSQQTIPTVPTTAPTLPTPFPQPYDSDLSQNFSSVSCFDFFQNMTNTVPFRTCRAFSFLLQASDAFIAAQEDLNELNSIVWGTCNTDTDADNCAANMAWFESTLTSACAEDLKAANSMARSAQIALNSYGVMRSAGCLVDPVSNTYCYLNAVHNSNPSDSYYYSLPLGISIPNNTIASCSACTESLMTLYYSALGDDGMGALKETYPTAAKIAVADCGTSYATLVAESSAPRQWSAGAMFLPFALAVALGF
ncbi:F-box domain-containing protein [Mycena chlorophos]|uniref:F-box domain-containing protein n=1 Tax=Mycena chlorophos TaxID=658473 RepID=A0A8H6TK66_MYCCL|nr:F-box domain-containing protein [Mycena chlorophos]